MKSIGSVLHLSKSGRLIIKSDQEVKIGMWILDKNGKKIAKVHEIIGSVKSPYISATPLEKHITKVIGKAVYI
jgi:rRNA processing protein Gar1|tara:strand:+ start:1538 stop:1756 length:219 start_codon:yes stop_codon:yes gene_type:complete